MLPVLPKAVYKTNKDLPFQGLPFKPLFLPQTPGPPPKKQATPLGYEHVLTRASTRGCPGCVVTLGGL